MDIDQEPTQVSMAIESEVKESVEAAIDLAIDGEEEAREPDSILGKSHFNRRVPKSAVSSNHHPAVSIVVMDRSVDERTPRTVPYAIHQAVKGTRVVTRNSETKPLYFPVKDKGKSVITGIESSEREDLSHLEDDALHAMLLRLESQVVNSTTKIVGKRSRGNEGTGLVSEAGLQAPGDSKPQRSRIVGQAALDTPDKESRLTPLEGAQALLEKQLQAKENMKRRTRVLTHEELRDLDHANKKAKLAPRFSPASFKPSTAGHPKERSVGLFPALPARPVERTGHSDGRRFKNSPELRAKKRESSARSRLKRKLTAQCLDRADIQKHLSELTQAYNRPKAEDPLVIGRRERTSGLHVQQPYDNPGDDREAYPPVISSQQDTKTPERMRSDDSEVAAVDSRVGPQPASPSNETHSTSTQTASTWAVHGSDPVLQPSPDPPTTDLQRVRYPQTARKQPIVSRKSPTPAPEERSDAELEDGDGDGDEDEDGATENEPAYTYSVRRKEWRCEKLDGQPLVNDYGPYLSLEQANRIAGRYLTAFRQRPAGPAVRQVLIESNELGLQTLHYSDGALTVEIAAGRDEMLREARIAPRAARVPRRVYRAARISYDPGASGPEGGSGEGKEKGEGKEEEEEEKLACETLGTFVRLEDANATAARAWLAHVEAGVPDSEYGREVLVPELRTASRLMLRGHAEQATCFERRCERRGDGAWIAWKVCEEEVTGPRN